MNTELSEQELLELDGVCVQFEKNWRPDTDLLETVLASANDRTRPYLLRELVPLECELRRAGGADSSCDAYRQRLPQWSDEIDAACSTCPLNGEGCEAKPAHPERLGDYRIVREIGRGASGIVYEAEQESLGRFVAIKVLTAYALFIPEAVERFQRESRAVAALHHSNIVQIHGTGEERGQHYFAMQLVDGVGVDHFIRELRENNEGADHSQVGLANGWRDVTSIGVQVASALAYAHGRGILHRDIKPANLILEGETVWVTDFGLAKMRQEESDATQTGDIIGTLRYLPPEAIEGKWDERGDVYSLGLTLYELLTLRPAFGDRNRTSLLHRISQGEPPVSPRKIDPTIPRDVDTVIMKSIARDPKDRYQTTDALGHDLQQLLVGQPITARRAGAAERLWKWSQRKPSLAALVAVLTLVATVGFPVVGYLWLSAEGAKKEAETALDHADAVGYSTAMQLAQSFIEQQQTKEVRSLLDTWSSHSGKAFSEEVGSNQHTGAFENAWEWDYLNSQLNASKKIVGTLTGGPPLVIAVRSDGLQMASASAEKFAGLSSYSPRRIQLWDVESGEVTHTLPRVDESLPQGVKSLVYSPDGRWLAATGLDYRLLVWDTYTGELLQDVAVPTDIPPETLFNGPKHFAVPPSVSFSSDGRWLSLSKNPTFIFDTETWEVKHTIKGIAAAFVHEPNQIVAFAGSEGMLFDAETGQKIQTIKSEAAVREISVAANAKRMCTRTFAGVQLWKFTPHLEAEKVVHRSTNWIDLSPNGKLLASSNNNGVLEVRNVDNPRAHITLVGHNGFVRDGVFHPNSSAMFTCSDDLTIREWEPQRKPGRRVFTQVDLNYGAVSDMAFGPDQESLLAVRRWIASKQKGTLWRCDLTNGLWEHSDLEMTNRVKWPRTDVAFSHDGRWLALPAGENQPGKKVVLGDAESGRVNIFSTESERKVRSLELPEDAVTSLAWSRDDSRLAVAYYGDTSEIGVYDLGDLEAGATKTSKESSAPMRRLSVDGRQVTATSFNSTGEQIAASTALGLHIWDLQSDEATSSVLKPSHTHEQPEFASFLDWSEKDLLAVSYKEANLVRVFERSGSQLKYEVPTPRYPTCVRFAPGGDRLAIAGRDAVVHFCEAQNGHRLLTLKDSSNHSGTIALTVRVVFSRDGRRIAVNDWLGRITIWECRPK